MLPFGTQKVKDFMMDIQSLKPEQYEIAVQIRDIHFDCDPLVSEDIKYGGLVFFKEKALMSGIFFYKAHMSLELGNGAHLLDPDGVLEGKGKDRRHIKIRSLEDITTKNVSQYVQASLAS